MSQQPQNQTISFTNLMVMEEYESGSPESTPRRRTPAPSARKQLKYDSSQAAKSPPDLITFSPGSPKQGGQAILNDVAQIVSDFQDSCDEVMANLTRLQQSAGGSPSESPDGGAGTPAFTNLVKPKLEEMLTVTDYAQNYTDERNRHLNDLKNLIQENQIAIEQTQESLDKFDNAIQKGTEFLPRFMSTWKDFSDGFAQNYSNLMIENPPFPNLNAIDHPSPAVTQESYAGLIWDMVNMCHVAERQCRLNEVMYSDLDGLVDRIKVSLENGNNMLEKLEVIRETLAREDQQVMNSFKEKEDNIKRFLEEWEKGPDELNHPVPSPPSSNDRSTSYSQPSSPSPSPSPQPVTSCVQRPKATPSKSRTTPTSSKSSPVDEIVQRFADMKNVALQEIQGLRDQQQVLEQSMIAVKNVPETCIASSKQSSTPESPKKPPETSGELDTSAA